MTFADAIRTILESSSDNACKRPSWKGYVKVMAADTGDSSSSSSSSSADEETEAYKIVLVTGNSTAPNATVTTVTDGDDSIAGTGDDVGTYVMLWDGGTWIVPTGDNQLVMDKELWAAMLASDWETGTAEAFEIARLSGGGRW